MFSSTVAYGRTAGFFAILGNSTGILLHTLAVSFGLSSLFQHIPIVYTIVKWLGIYYLAFLAVKIFITKGSFHFKKKSDSIKLAISFKNGIFVNLFNPKTFLLMLALLPQFVTPEKGHVQIQIGCLGLFHIIMASAILTALCFSAHSLSHSISESWIFRRLLRWLSASLVLVFAIKLYIANY